VSNCVFCFPFHNDDSEDVATPAYTGGDWVENSDYSLDNLKDEHLFNVARSASVDLADTQFDVDLGLIRSILVLSLLPGVVGRSLPGQNGTWSRSTRVRASWSDTPGDFSDPAKTTGWTDVYKVVYAAGTLPVGHPSFMDGKLGDEDARGYRIPWIHVFDEPVIARYWRFEIDDQLNASGYLDIARLIMAPGWQPTFNLSNGARLGFDTNTTFEQTIGGPSIPDVGAVWRELVGEIQFLPEDEAFSWPFEMLRNLGTAGQLFFIFKPEDVAHMHRRSFLCTLRRLTPLEFSPVVDTNSWPVELKERL